MEISPDQFAACLAEIRPTIGNYEWMWRILRLRARPYGWVPQRLHDALRRFGNVNRPCFIGRTDMGTAFVGDYRERYAATCAVCGKYDEPLIRFMLAQMESRPGIYLDVGANIGVTAAGMARSLPAAGEVIAFEPIPATARRAAGTFALNELRNIRLFEVALGYSDGDLEFYNSPGDSETASAYATQRLSPREWMKTTVPCRRLDTLMDQGLIGRVSLMKIDVEGHEPEMLRGALGLIARDRPIIIYEYHSSIAPQVGWTVDDIAALLAPAARYRCYWLAGNNEPRDLPVPPDDDTAFNILCEPLDPQPS